MEYTDIYATGYEWVCPKCGTRNIEEDCDCPKQVKCSNPQCYTEFETNLIKED